MEKNDMATLADVIGAGEVARENLETVQEESQETQEPVQANTETQLAEPGYVQRRIQRALKETEAKYESQLSEMRGQLNALMETNLAVQARERVAAGDFKTEELAMEYLRMKNGMPAPEKAVVQSEKPRDAQGRYTKAENVDSGTQQRANELFAQAQMLNRATGVDVLGLYNSDPEIKQKVLSGEWDFADVLKNAQTESGVKSAPTPVRNSNGIGLGGYNIRGMSGNDFAKLNKMLEEGAIVDMRK